MQKLAGETASAYHGTKEGWIDEFDGMAWTLEALFGNEEAVSESIEMLETYNLYMG